MTRTAGTKCAPSRFAAKRSRQPFNMKILISISLVAILFSCSGVLNIESKNIKTEKQRIKVLKKYYKIRLDVIDVVFKIYNVNGKPSISIPGPTDYDYEVGMQIISKDINILITDKKIYKENIDLNWIYKLNNDNQKWKLESKPKVYINTNKQEKLNDYIVYYETEGIIFRKLKNG